MTRTNRAPVALGALAIAAVLFLFVFPTRSYLSQRRHVAAAEHDLRVLRDQNQKLQVEANGLRSRSEIERRARSQFNMVFPGEEVFKVMPRAPAASTTPGTTVP